MSDATPTFVIGTAGHIDHGKTSLVRALTGVDLDRLPEEKERGITIALGFTPLTLPGGRIASFVDVPGHERLVRTMIAGATGLDAAMLCISASEGVMPQTREHLAILQLLQLRYGVVALTMSDLVDDETVELARMEVEELVVGTFLEGAPIIATSATTARGLSELVAALDALPQVQRPAQGIFRLPVDRVFVQRGFGSVVTGTIASGTLTDGDEVEILPEGLRCRVRGLQVHGEKRKSSVAGQRTAVNLAGIERDDLARGFVVTHKGQVPTASILDARYSHLAEAPPLQTECQVRLLVGTAEVMAVLSVLDGDMLQPGHSHLVQLRTEAPLVALPRDRFVLRLQSPVLTLGGGVVLDPWASRARRKHRDQAVRELKALEAGDPMVLLARAGDEGLDAAGLALRGIAEAPMVGDRYLHPSRLAVLQARLLDALGNWHTEHPFALGAPRRELHGSELSHLSQKAFDALVSDLAGQELVVLEGPNVRVAGFSIMLDEDQEQQVSGIEEQVRAAGLEGPRLVELPADVSTLLVNRGTLVRVGPFVVHSAHTDALASQVRELIAARGSMSPADFKDLTGLSRKLAIPLLEWLDASGVTVRRGDVRMAR